MWHDDISFCPYSGCRHKECLRCQLNIRDRTVPHSYFVDTPPDCLLKGTDIPENDNDFEKASCANCRFFDHYNVECLAGHNPNPPYDRWFCASREE